MTSCRASPQVVICRPSLECPSERDGEALVAERRFDRESGLLADGGELATKTQAQRVASKNGQRGVCAVARSERGGAEADERLGRANTIVFGKAILKYTGALDETAEPIRLRIGCRIGHLRVPAGYAGGWFTRQDHTLSEPYRRAGHHKRDCGDEQPHSHLENRCKRLSVRSSWSVITLRSRILGYRRPSCWYMPMSSRVRSSCTIYRLAIARSTLRRRSALAILRTDIVLGRTCGRAWRHASA